MLTYYQLEKVLKETKDFAPITRAIIAAYLDGYRQGCEDTKGMIK